MAELAEMVSIPTGVNAWTVMLGKTVKAISVNVDQSPVKMVVPVKMKSTLTAVPVRVDTLETNVKRTLMTVLTQTPANMVANA